ncbi:MAG: glutamate--tRNA ligase, partial [Patescibacteria group bacterium]
FGPYVQSERLEIYKKYAEQLVKEEKAYYCFCTAERLEQVKKQQSEKGVPPCYDGHCRGLDQSEIKKEISAGRPYVIRQRVPKTGLTEYDDLVYGHLQFKNELLDDSILIKSDGYPVYNFANVIDDHLMEISHVIRGEEFLSSTPKHIMLYNAFGWTPPVFAHLPLILDAKRQKLSKRSGDVAVEEYVKKGYLKEALLNFIALLGWNPKTEREIFSLEELVEEFSFEKVNKGGSIFDVIKLDYINREWQKKLNLEPKEDPMFRPVMEALKSNLGSSTELLDTESVLTHIWSQVLERISGPSAVGEQAGEFTFYLRLPDYDSKMLSWKKQKPEEAKKILSELNDFIQNLADKDFELSVLEKSVKDFLQGRGVSLGEGLWPLRVALSGQKNSPSPFEIMSAFAAAGQKQIILDRIETALEKLK